MGLENAIYTNGIGSAQLIGSWTDERFDPERHSLYYMRVLEIPTPRWTTYDAVEAGLPLLEGVPANEPGTRLDVANLVHAVALAYRWDKNEKDERDRGAENCSGGGSAQRSTPKREPRGDSKK